MYLPNLPVQRRTLSFVAVLVVVFVAEAVAMWLVGALFPDSGRANWRETVVDAVTVVALSGPFVWWLVIRPLGAALRGGHRFSQTLFDNPGALVVVLDGEGRIVRFNPGCELATGYAVGEVVGRELFGLLIPEDVRARVREVFAQCIGGGEFPRHYQNEWLNRDGGRRWIVWTNDVLRDDAGRIEYVVANGLDLTGQRRQEQQLRDSEARFRLLFDSADDAILVHPAPLGRFVDVNPAACKRLGYTREELLRLGPRDIDSPCAECDDERVQAELAASGAARFERIHLARDGHAIPVEIATRLFDLDGMPHVISIARDIAAQKAAERRLQDSEARLRALIEAIDQSAILMTLDGTVLALNTVAAARLGHTPESVVGRDIYAMIPPQVAETRRRRIEQLAVDGRPVNFEDERNGLRLRHSIVPIKDPAGAVMQVAIFAEDITEATLLRHTDDLLHGFDQQVLGGHGFVDILRFACQRLSRDFGYEAVWVGRKMADGSVHLLHAAGIARDYVEAILNVGVRWDDMPAGHDPVGVTIRTGEARAFDVGDADSSPWARMAGRYGLRSILGLPLIVRGEVFGAVLLYSRDADAFAGADTVGRLRHVCVRLNVVVEMAEKQQQMQLLRLAIETAGSGILVTRRDGVIEWSNRALRQMTGYSEVELIGRTPRLFKSGMQDAEYYRRFWETLALGDTWRGETVNTRKDGSLVTVMQIVTSVRDIGGEISHYISVMEDISLRKEAEERIRHLAEHDALTDLPNRVLMQTRLTRMLTGEKRRGQELVGVLYLDVDRFKQVNDDHGHDVGDALLRGFAERLRDVVRAEDTVARVGGDEFVVLLPSMQGVADAETVARKILADLETPIDCLGTAIRIGTSIGIAHAPAHAGEPTALLKCADMAMYAAKQAGRNTCRVFAAAMAAPPA